MSHQNTLSGLIISKQGVQAVASDDTVSGLICLKVSLPLERGENAPTLLGTPEIHSLPLKTPSAPLLRTASRLLNLASSYPPFQHSAAARPGIEVSNSTGQVYITLGSRRPGGKSTLAGKEGRREWLILVRFQVRTTRHGHANLVSLGLPKCLDNVVRFQILTPHASSSSDTGEVNVTTEPKVRPVSSSTFQQPTPRSPAVRRPAKERRSGGAKSVGQDEGWEDGEDMGPTGVSTDEEDEAEQTEQEEESDLEGSWLEGRFPSTDRLRLEWTFGTPPPTSSWLVVSPRYDQRSSSIHVQYQSLPLPSGTTSVETVIPDGWGWSSLSIHGETLVDWISADGDWWAESHQQTGARQVGPDESGVTEVEDSFSTAIQRLRPSTPSRAPLTPPSIPVKSPNNVYSSVSLLKQKIPSHLSKMEDFSFELSQASAETTKPYTPISKPSTPSPSFGQPPQSLYSSQVDSNQSHLSRRPISAPAPAKLFDLTLSSPGRFMLEGTLVPISRLTHVSPTLPLNVPFIRIEGRGDSATHDECEVTCTGSILDRQILETARSSIGTFSWTDEDSQPFTESPAPIQGDVDVRLVKDPWGLMSMHIAFTWPKRATEVGFAIQSSDFRLAKATIGGEAIPRAFTTHDGETQFRFGSEGRKSERRLEVALDLRAKDTVPLPQLQGNGIMTVHLVGDHWDLGKTNMSSNMVHHGASKFRFNLASTTPPILTFTSSEPTSAKVNATRVTRGLLSWSTLINLLLVWILISLAIQVQRLRNEVAFVAEEARDLRLYGLTTPTTTASSNIASSSADIVRTPTINFDATSIWSSGASLPTGKDVMKVHRDGGSDVKTSLGRVVFGRSAWDKWASHPAVRSIGHGIGRGIDWVWQSVVWLVNPL